MGALTLMSERRQAKRQREFLESKGIQVPPQRWVERIGELDVENLTISGAALGILLASFRPRPSSVSVFAYFTGAASFAYWGVLTVTPFVPWPQLRDARAKYESSMKRRRPQDQEEFLAFSLGGHATTMPGGGKSAFGEAVTAASTLSQMFKRGSNTVEDEEHDREEQAMRDHLAEENAEHELDKNDPQPHLSRLIDGERSFRTQTNYKWTPGPEGEQMLKSHLDYLRQRRTALSREAELFWHQIAVKEAEFYSTKSGTERKEHLCAALEIMNECHVNIWVQISLVDWMIADSSKNLLQLEAMKEKRHWIPELPKEASTIRPALTLKLLQELRLHHADYLEEVRLAAELVAEDHDDPIEERVLEDPRTGEISKDPKQLLEDMRQLSRKLVEEAEIKDRASQELLMEYARQHGQTKR